MKRFIAFIGIAACLFMVGYATMVESIEKGMEAGKPQKPEGWVMSQMLVEEIKVCDHTTAYKEKELEGLQLDLYKEYPGQGWTRITVTYVNKAGGVRIEETVHIRLESFMDEVYQQHSYCDVGLDGELDLFLLNLNGIYFDVPDKEAKHNLFQTVIIDALQFIEHGYFYGMEDENKISAEISL